MIMPNIPALIAWGIFTAFFIAKGFPPNADLATIVGPTTDDEITVEYPPLPSGVDNVTVVTPHGYAIDAITALA